MLQRPSPCFNLLSLLTSAVKFIEIFYLQLKRHFHAKNTRSLSSISIHKILLEKKNFLQNNMTMKLIEKVNDELLMYVY